MKNVKMLQNFPWGGDVLRGDQNYEMTDAVADALLADGRAVLVGVAPAEDVPTSTSDDPSKEKGKKK